MTVPLTASAFSGQAGSALTMLLDASAKGALLLLAAGTLTALLSRRSAAHRHAVWVAAMLGLLLLPVVSALAPGRPWRVLPLAMLEGDSGAVSSQPSVVGKATGGVSSPEGAPQQRGRLEPMAGENAARLPSPVIESAAQENRLATAADSQTAARQADPPPASASRSQSTDAPRIATAPASILPPRPSRQWSVAALVFAAWALGAGVCLLSVSLDLLALKWIAARAAQITRGPWMETFDRMRQERALPPVMLLERPGSGMPLACGIVAPTLVLPGEARAWPPQRRQAVLAHELAHVNRRDCATQLLARLACALHWFNPLAWYAARRMRMERERACDDLVIASAASGRGGAAAAAQPDADAAEYASHLLEVARSLRAARFGSLAGVAMARPSQLEGRLLAVLDQQKDHRPVGRRFVAGGIVAVLVSVGALAFVRLAPRAAAQEAAVPRLAGPAPTSKPVAPSTSDKSPAPTAFADGQKVEVKWGGIWRKADVVSHRGQWILVDYDGNRFLREWVEPWRVRTTGSAYDIDGQAPINSYVHHNEGPPRDMPGPAPVGAGVAEGGATNDPPSDVPVTQVMRQNARAVSLDLLPPLTPLTPDVAPPARWTTAPITLRGSSGQFFDHPEALLLSPASGIGAVLHFNAPPGNASRQYRVERFDLKTGRSINVATLPLELQLLDLSADGRLLLARTGPFGPGNGARLDVWQIDGEQAAHVVTFMPFTARTGGEKIVWAGFVGADHVIARSFDGELSCFEFRSATQVWSARAGLANNNALSPTGKYLAASTGKSIAILEPLSGKVLGGIDLDGRPAQALAFKPDGRQIAAAGQDEVAVWDLARAAAPVVDAWAVGAPGQCVEWGGEGYLLLDHAHLVSMDKQLVVWTYQGVGSAMHGGLAQTCNGRMYYTADAASPGSPHRPVVPSVALPDDDVRSRLAAAGEPKLALRPGMSLSLVVRVDRSIRQQLIDALTSKLKANGVDVAENSPVKLVVRDEPGETREVSYRRIGFRALGQTDKVRVREIKRSIAISVGDDTPAWQRGGTMMPPIFLSLKEGQSIEQAVDQAMKPSPRFYQDLRIPRLIPVQPEGFGITPLSGNGPQPARAPSPKPVRPTPPKLEGGTQARADARNLKVVEREIGDALDAMHFF